jgi:hypothetical protein
MVDLGAWGQAFRGDLVRISGAVILALARALHQVELEW